jgi:act minimal PKS acyl carrier protein
VDQSSPTPSPSTSPSSSPFTVDDLRALLPAEDGDELTVDDIDLPFDRLGYDSLAMLELGSQLQRQLGVTLPDDIQSELPTPRLVIDRVNETLGAVSHPEASV